MMKYAISFVALCLIGMATFAQSITPLPTTEFCPDQEVTFTVTIPGQNPTVSSWINAPFVTQAPYNVSSTASTTTFNFKGRFRDFNGSQQFRIAFNDNVSGGIAEYIPKFNRIKSLASTMPCAVVQPNQTSISFPFCQITSQPITFSNVQWGTTGESPLLCFGSIATYEFLLPSGWSLNGTPSNGVTWLPGTSGATVTSDLSTGEGVKIQVRPRNSCGTSFQNNQIAGEVTILRPKPVLTLSASQDYICNVGETAQFSIPNLPASATVAWTVNEPTMASVVGSNSANPVTITKSSNVNALVNVTATVTQCGYTYPPLTKQIALGTGRTTVFFQSHQVVCESPSRPYYYGSVEEFPSANFYEWYLKDNTSASNPFVLQQAMNTNTADFPLRRGNRYYTVRVNAYTPCGMAQSIVMDGVIYAPACTGGARLSASVGADALQVALADDAEPGQGIREVVLRNLQGQILLQQVLEGQDREAQFPLDALPSGLYVVSVWDGSTWSSTKVIKA